MGSLPFTEFELFQGVHDAFQLPENEPQVRGKPRASSLTSDAREIAYMMANTPKSNPHREDPERVDGAYTAEQGRLAEEITIGAMSALGFSVVDRQVDLPADYCVTGHPDGRIDGTNTGFEHKLFGRFAYKEIARDGIWGPKGRDILAQAALYGDALGWDRVLIVIVSQDASSMRMEFRNKQFKDKGIHPKAQMYLVEMEQLQPLLPALKARAEWFIDWMKTDGDPANVMWETAPAIDRFPWSYSEWRDRAISDGQGTKKAPPPFLW